tara:strand:- start:631 stop:819 length:189 start_codon:yes stop_codon:yes gene_type:complete
MKEYIDGLIEGSHRKTEDEIHAWAKASRKRVKEAKEVSARREATAKNKICKLKPYVKSVSEL